MRKPVAHYPLWLRAWHWTNAAFFVALIVSGLALHYASPANTILPFQTARIIHNFTGIALSVAYLVFLLGNIFTPNGKHYIPKRAELTEGLWVQLKYYLVGIFRGDPHPYHHSDEQKFNPIQKLTYLGIMYLAAPVVIATGIVLLFPEVMPRQIWNMSGVLPVAVLHSAIGFFLSLFLVGHIYLASTGETIAANSEAMFTGYRSEEYHPGEEEQGDRVTPDRGVEEAQDAGNNGEGEANETTKSSTAAMESDRRDVARTDS